MEDWRKLLFGQSASCKEFQDAMEFAIMASRMLAKIMAQFRTDEGKVAASFEDAWYQCLCPVELATCLIAYLNANAQALKLHFSSFIELDESTTFTQRQLPHAGSLLADDPQPGVLSAAPADAEVQWAAWMATTANVSTDAVSPLPFEGDVPPDPSAQQQQLYLHRLLERMLARGLDVQPLFEPGWEGYLSNVTLGGAGKGLLEGLAEEVERDVPVAPWEGGGAVRRIGSAYRP